MLWVPAAVITAWRMNWEGMKKIAYGAIGFALGIERILLALGEPAVELKPG